MTVTKLALYMVLGLALLGIGQGLAGHFKRQPANFILIALFIVLIMYGWGQAKRWRKKKAPWLTGPALIILGIVLMGVLNSIGLIRL